MGNLQGVYPNHPPPKELAGLGPVSLLLFLHLRDWADAPKLMSARWGIRNLGTIDTRGCHQGAKEEQVSPGRRTWGLTRKPLEGRGSAPVCDPQHFPPGWPTPQLWTGPLNAPRWGGRPMLSAA